MTPREELALTMEEPGALMLWPLALGLAEDWYLAGLLSSSSCLRRSCSSCCGSSLSKWKSWRESSQLLWRWRCLLQADGRVSTRERQSRQSRSSSSSSKGGGGGGGTRTHSTYGRDTERSDAIVANSSVLDVWRASPM